MVKYEGNPGEINLVLDVNLTFMVHYVLFFALREADALYMKIT